MTESESIALDTALSSEELKLVAQPHGGSARRHGLSNEGLAAQYIRARRGQGRN